MSGWTMRALVLSTVLAAAAYLSAATNVGIQEYGAVRDDVSGDIIAFGQHIVHRTHDVTIGETTRKVPIFSLQHAGPHYREGAWGDPNHVEGRALSVAERLAHAWALMDRGAAIEILPDDWNAQRVHPRNGPAACPAIFIQNTAAGLGPLRIVTAYPEDVAGYPWITSERSLAEYWAALIEAHYLLFWKCESEMNRYNNLRICRTREGRIFRDVALRAVALARSRGQNRFDAETLRAVLAALPPSQRQTLCRLATAPPADWESSPR